MISISGYCETNLVMNRFNNISVLYINSIKIVGQTFDCSFISFFYLNLIFFSKFAFCNAMYNSDCFIGLA